MTDRGRERAEFLKREGWDGAGINMLAEDASHRQYFRLSRSDGSRSILMDAPPDRFGPLRPFVSVTAFLRGLGLSAPNVFASDEASGFLLLEDLGDAIYARILERSPEIEPKIYFAAIDLLAYLHGSAPMDGLPVYSPEVQSELAALSLHWYRYGVTGQKPSDDLDGELRGIVESNLNSLNGESTFIHRDFHAENLIWLSHRPGYRNVGLLDYQDAHLGSRVYDLVSLIEDARRDLAPGLRERIIRRYAERIGVGEKTVLREIAISGAQRNLRIVGVFARLAMRDGKRGYVSLLPRVWNHLMSDISNPELADLAAFVNRHLPPPNAESLNRLRALRN